MFNTFIRRFLWSLLLLTFTALCSGARADLIVGESSVGVYLYASPNYNEQTFFNSQASGIAPLSISGFVANDGSGPSGEILGGGGTVHASGNISSTWISPSRGNVDFSIEATAPAVFFGSQSNFPSGSTAGLHDGFFRHTFTSTIPFQYIVSWQTTSVPSGGLSPGLGISVGNGLGSYAFVPLEGDGQFTINAVAGTHQFFYRLEGPAAQTNPAFPAGSPAYIALDANFNWQVVTAVPEPSSLVFGLPGLAIATLLRRRRTRPELPSDEQII